MADSNAKKSAKQKSQSGLVLGSVSSANWIIFILAFLLYANTLGHQYAFDDSIVITENQFTQKGFGGIKDLLTRDFFEGIYGKQTELSGGRYRPLSLLTFAVEYQLFGLNPFVGHLLNVLLFSVLCVLILLTLRDWFGNKSTVPLLATLLFVVHPIHTEVVANIKSRDEILCAIFVFLSVRVLHRLKDSSPGPLVRSYLLCAFYFFLALMAKETAITLWPLLACAGWVFRNATFSGTFRQLLVFLIPMMVYMLLRTKFVGLIGGSDSSDIMENPFFGVAAHLKYPTIFKILLKYFMLLWIPHPLLADYSFNQIPYVGFGNPLALAGMLLHLLLLGFGIKALFERKPLGFSVLWYLAPLSIVSNLVFNIGAPMGERFLFISSFGFCMAIGILLQERIFKINKGQVRLNGGLPPILFCIVLLVFAGKTVQRNFVWYDNARLFRHDVEVGSQSAKMQYYCANSYIKEYIDNEKRPEDAALLDKAEFHLKKGLEINPEFHYLLYNMGLMYNLRDNGPLARDYLLKTLELFPAHKKSIRLIGEVYARLLGDFPKAIEYLEMARNQFGDESVQVLQGLGNVYGMSGQFAKSIQAFEQLLAQDPQNGTYYLNLAITYDRMGNASEAKKYYDQAFALDPALKK